MKVDVPAGKYVVAVSGGVDSVVLLHLLAEKARSEKLWLVVAHFDHGIRQDSAADRKFVQRLAAEYGLPFVYDQAKLGKGASEAKAREARYAFLKKVAKAMHADGIITAHHQDDLLETIIINWLRGTKSKGLSSLRSTKRLLRPLLGASKPEIRAYAEAHKLRWHEDSTNEDESYLRNYIRRRIIPKLNDEARRQLLRHSTVAAELNQTIHLLTSEYLQQYAPGNELDRVQFQTLPESVAYEVLAEWLRVRADTQITTKLLDRLVAAIRTGRNGSKLDVTNGHSLLLSKSTVILTAPQ